MSGVHGAHYLPRELDGPLADAVRSFPIVVLDGPRGVGKTTSALRLVRSTVELPRDLERMRIDAEAFLAGLPTPVLIDEWQIAGTDLLWSSSGWSMPTRLPDASS